jgi:hypothetical protein
VDDNNLIVVELKRSSNNIEKEQRYDYLKLELFTKQDYYQGFGYKLGASMYASKQPIWRVSG